MPAPYMEASSDARSQTVLDLIGLLMESAFEELGEGVILASMPRYLERFGADNARHLMRHYVTCDPDQGALSALTPLNHVSRVTGTPFTLVQASRRRTVKRLHGCEFLDAFKDRGQFPRAMICHLHAASYRGSVNATLEDPARGYDVTVGSRILFGDPHCDFEVVSRDERPDAPDQEGQVRHAPDAADRATLTFDFYAYILASFVDYMAAMLPGPRLEALATACGHEAGRRLQAREGLPADGQAALLEVLRLTGHEVAAPNGAGALVSRCPHENSVRAATQGSAADTARAARRIAGTLCQAVVAGAVQAASGEGRLDRQTTEHAGRTAWRYQIRTG